MEKKIEELGDFPVILQVIQKKNKKNKKKKNNNNNKNHHEESLLYYFLFFGCIVLSCFIGYQLLAPPDISMMIREKPYQLVKRGSDTTSIPYTDEEERMASEYHKILSEYHHDHPVICLHHIDIQPRYRICLLERVYLIVNPSIVPDKQFLLDITEHSVSCHKEMAKKRFQCVNMEWTDGSHHHLRGNFCGDTAISIQMMMDEFNGNKHC